MPQPHVRIWKLFSSYFNGESHYQYEKQLGGTITSNPVQVISIVSGTFGAPRPSAFGNRLDGVNASVCKNVLPWVLYEGTVDLIGAVLRTVCTRIGSERNFCYLYTLVYLLMNHATHHYYAASLKLHTLQRKQGEQPVSQIFGDKSSVQAVPVHVCPRVFRCPALNTKARMRGILPSETLALIKAAASRTLDCFQRSSWMIS